MRVLLVSDLVPPARGGLEFHVAALAAELARRGDDVAVVTLTRNPTPVAGVRIIPLQSFAHLLPHHDRDRPFHPPIPDPVARRALRRLIDDFAPDVIHGHSWLTVSLPGSRSVPVVFTAHDYGLICQLRTLMQPDVDVCSGPAIDKCIACGTPSYGRVTSELLARTTPYGRRHFPADRIVAVSSAVRDALSPYVDVPIRTIPNFVGDEAPAEPLPDSIPERFVLYAGDGRSYKGVPELLDVWHRTPPRLPLVIASQRPPTDALPAGVVSVSLTRGQMTSAWQRAELAAIPSRWADPCPTVVLEAMRAGVPVVGTDAGGIAEMVRDGVDGVIVAPRDAAALGRSIKDLLDDDVRRRRLGANARQRSSEFTVEVVTDRLREVYKEVIAG